VKRSIVIGATAALALSVAAAPAGVAASVPQDAAETEYVVLYKEGVNAADAQRAITEAGGTIVKENTAVGLATVRTANAEFAKVVQSEAVEGVARNRVIGKAPEGDKAAAAEAARKARAAVEKAGRGGGRPDFGRPKPAAEPLADAQWDMKQINATVDGSYRYNQGDRDVLVGVLDTGVDASHPDIAPNFNAELSRNFTTDIPYGANGDPVDGPCEEEPDRSCEDPADVDENDHGTHVASTIAAPLNGLGIGGVAPRVQIVNLRAGQDSGYFFLQPTVDALTYAGDHGIDVVNMSYYIDPWLFNCVDNPADSPEERMEQATTIKAMQRALDYAHARGVTLVSSAGNGSQDFTKEIVDTSSPNFVSEPGRQPRTRTIPPSCVSMPSEGKNVIAVSAVGPSKRKAYYSDYGNGYVDVAAPGGDAYDTPDNTLDLGGAILAAYPKSLAEERGELNPDGTPKVEYVIRDCKGDQCAYYQYLQGTSMASPHVAGVAALIVSKYGKRDRVHGGKTLNPSVVEAKLKATATKTACPTPREFTYTLRPSNGQTVTMTHVCEGGKPRNGFYGHGIVDALRAGR